VSEMQGIEYVQDPLPGMGKPEEIVHACPVAGSQVTPCCGKTPFELLHGHRLTLNPRLVTCKGKVTSVQDSVSSVDEISELLNPLPSWGKPDRVKKLEKLVSLLLDPDARWADVLHLRKQLGL
jgi:hypothetical protein